MSRFAGPDSHPRVEVDHTPADSGVMTIATGKVEYFEMALSLARSFEYWHRETGLQLYIVTDLDVQTGPGFERSHILRVPPGSLGSGFVTKLNLDWLAPCSRTLFIDADCLCYGSLLPVMERFRGSAVSVVGSYISSGEWFGDVGAVCQALNVAALPKFNGGIYYVEKGELCSNVYEYARSLVGRYADLGLRTLRGQPNDELLVAIAMAVTKQEPLPDDGSIMADLYAYPEVRKADVLEGLIELRNPPAPSPVHRSWNSRHLSEPAIVHFLGSFGRSILYRRECLKLLLATRYRLNMRVVGTVAKLAYVPHEILEETKNVLRPAFHAMVGARKIKSSFRG